MHDLHAPPAAAERGLDRDRPAVLFAERLDLVRAGGELDGPGDDRRAASQRGLAARHLVAHLLDRRRGRSDERDSHLGDRPCELGVLGEEAVAGVHAVGVAAPDRIENHFRIEVALGGRLPAERERLVGEAHVQRVAVEL